MNLKHDSEFLDPLKLLGKINTEPDMRGPLSRKEIDEIENKCKEIQSKFNNLDIRDQIEFNYFNIRSDIKHISKGEGYNPNDIIRTYCRTSQYDSISIKRNTKKMLKYFWILNEAIPWKIDTKWYTLERFITKRMTYPEAYFFLNNFLYSNYGFKVSLGSNFNNHKVTDIIKVLERSEERLDELIKKN